MQTQQNMLQPAHQKESQQQVAMRRAHIHVSAHQNRLFYVDKKNQLDVTFCILYFSSNSCSTCLGQPCAHHQELTTT